MSLTLTRFTLTRFILAGLTLLGGLGAALRRSSVVEGILCRLLQEGQQGKENFLQNFEHGLYYALQARR